MKKITIYDTTLRDGAQAEDVSFSVEDKVRVARKLDELGVGFIEGGWPGSNPRDAEFYTRLKKEKLKRATLAAFGSTRKCGGHCGTDANLEAILKTEAPAATLVGKSWDFHVIHALNATLEENLDAIHDSISYLKKRMDVVVYDAEHFFDGFKHNPKYAIATLLAAEEAGADCVCLCDTNGGTLPMDVGRIVRQVKSRVSIAVGIHCHNDAATAVASSIIAVENGATQVQGTINGVGERCGNADLCAIIANLELKMGMKCLPTGKLERLKEVSRFVYEMANMPPPRHQPYVGESAFAHKGGLHVSAILKNSKTYEHIEPKLVGNKQRILVSDLSGRSNIQAKAKELGIKLGGDRATLDILKRIKDLENRGYQFEGADASFELLILEATHGRKKFFELRGFRVTDELRTGENKPYAEATIMVEVEGQGIEHTAAIGNGPVNALDNALRKAIERFYPRLKEVRLVDYKVRVLPAGEGTGSQVRVLIESTDGVDKWGTVGVSENIIKASYEALVDSIDYKLYKDERTSGRKIVKPKKSRGKK